MQAVGGVVYLVGAGPGDPELITVRGLKLVRTADVVLHDRLVSRETLAECRTDAEVVSVGKTPFGRSTPQERINHLLVEYALAGRSVVRLKGGDPFVFGRGGEELAACRAAGAPCVVVPGVSSAVAVPGVVGVPVTHRDVSRSFAVITGHTHDVDVPPHDFGALAGVDTLVLLMGLSNLAALTQRLIAAGRAPETPAVSIAHGTTPEQRVERGTLATIAARAAAAELATPTLTVIGPTAAWADAEDAEWCATLNGALGGIS